MVVTAAAEAVKEIQVIHDHKHVELKVQVTDEVVEVNDVVSAVGGG